MADAAEHFQQVAEQSEQALKEMRLLLFQLRPAALQQLGLVRALQQRLDTVERRVNIETRLETTGDCEHLPPRVEQDLYAIAQEALNNIAKHAKASQVDIDLKHDGTAIELRIHDDGQGFDPERNTSEHGHYGLNMMRERAEAAGVRLMITSQPGHGTELIMHWVKGPQKEAK